MTDKAIRELLHRMIVDSDDEGWVEYTNAGAWIADKAVAAIQNQVTLGRLDEVDEMIRNRHYGEGYAEFFTEYANNRRAALLQELNKEQS